MPLAGEQHGQFYSSSTSGSLITETPSPAPSLGCSPGAASFQGLQEDGLHCQRQAGSREGQWLSQREIQGMNGLRAGLTRRILAFNGRDELFEQDGTKGTNSSKGWGGNASTALPSPV